MPFSTAVEANARDILPPHAFGGDATVEHFGCPSWLTTAVTAVITPPP